MKNKPYEPLCGEHIGVTVRIITKLAKLTNETVITDFNEIELIANPGDDTSTILLYYDTETKRRREEYVTSPEYKERQRQEEEKQRRHDLMLEGALAVAPDKMTFKDEEGWKKAVEVNTDSYGSGVIHYAERWARLMESKITNGNTIEECAEKTSHLADNEGITGFMYGCAVSILSQVWIHGEELRRWHNLSIQIGNEGEKANKNGGTLNPASLNIG